MLSRFIGSKHGLYTGSKEYGTSGWRLFSITYRVGRTGHVPVNHELGCVKKAVVVVTCGGRFGAAVKFVNWLLPQPKK